MTHISQQSTDIERVRERQRESTYRERAPIYSQRLNAYIERERYRERERDI
jgi:hypothetical protein